MVYNYFIIKGYKLLGLNYIDKLVYTPSKPINIILGTNGSGKTSLLRELSLSPANLKKYYKEDGYKEVSVAHNGADYLLCSKNGKHSFKKNNKELNIGGTKKIYNQLLKEHFNYEDVHDVMMGYKNFTDMSVSERKEWLSKIADLDYSYAIGVYLKTKVRHRDITGGIKILESKLPHKPKDLLTQEDILNAKEDIKGYRHYIEVLNSTLRTTKNKEINLASAKVLFSKGNTILNEISKIKKELNIDNFKIDDVKETLTIKQMNLTQGLNHINFLKDEIQTLNNRTSNNTNKIQIVEENNNLEKELLNLGLTIPNEMDISNLASDLLFMEEKMSTIINIVSEYESLNISKSSIAEYDQIVENNQIKETTLNDFKRKISVSHEIKEQQESLMNEEKIECAKCGNIWVPGYNEAKLLDAKAKIKFYAERIERLEPKIEANKKKLIETRRYLEIVDKLKSDFMGIKLLHSIVLTHLQDKNSDSMSNVLSSELNFIYSNLQKFKRYIKNTKQILDNNEKLKLLKEVEDSSSTNERITELLEKLNVAQESKNVLSYNYEKYKQFHKLLLELNYIDTLTKKLAKTVFLNKKDNINKVYNESIKKLVEKLNLLIHETEESIIDSSNYYHLYNKIKTDITELQAREKVIAKLLKSLSPTEGIIAKSITSFLKIFVNEMNDVINKIWAYDLRILPCNVDESKDLDYKFPVLVDGKPNAEDVKQTSSSMNEIINLAFKLVSMKYLNMDSHPLYLDEFGRTMDPVHKLEAYKLVDRLSETTFKQIFLVSHFESVYTRFSNASINVLSDTNIILDKSMKYNNDLKINSET